MNKSTCSVTLLSPDTLVHRLVVTSFAKCVTGIYYPSSLGDNHLREVSEVSPKF